VALRDDLLLQLAQAPELADRERFIAGLLSTRLDVAHASAGALLALPPDETRRVLLPATYLLQRLWQEPREQELRGLVLQLLSRETGQPFTVNETASDPVSLRQAYAPVIGWLKQHHPAIVGTLATSAQPDATEGLRLLASVPWNRGNPARGEIIFRERGCALCHGGTTPLGPDLAGVTSRLSTRDLFQAILEPGREVPAAYRSVTFKTRAGETHTGMVVFESAEGVILQTGAATTIRLAEADIAGRQPSQLSIMPNGLLTGLNGQDYADLYGYLRTLTPQAR
jgi:putative heme-binding domain-containing protein